MNHKSDFKISNPDRFKQTTVLNLTLLASLLIVVSIASLIALNTIKRQIKKEMGDSLSVVLSTTHEALYNWAHDKMDDVGYWALMPGVRELVRRQLEIPPSRKELLSSSALEEMRHKIKPVIRIHSDRGFFVVSPDYINIMSMRDENLGRTNLLADQGDYLQRIFAGKAVITRPVRSDVPFPGGKDEEKKYWSTMFFGAPILDEAGEVIAALLIRFDPAVDFARIVQLGRIGETGETYAFDDRGILLSKSRFAGQLKASGLLQPGEEEILKVTISDPGVNLLEGEKPGTPKEERPLTLMAKSAVSGEYGSNLDGYRDYRGVTVIGHWLWDSDLGFGMTTEMDRDEAYKAYFYIRNILIAVLALTNFLFLIFSFMLMRSRRQTIRLAKEAISAAKAMEESEEKVHLLLDSTAEAIYGLDLNGNCTFANPACVNYLGYDSADDLLGQNMHILIHHTRPDGSPYPEKKCHIYKAFQQKVGTHIDDEVLWRKDGSSFPAEYWSYPVKGEGSIVGSVVTFLDITERKRGEKQLLESEALLKEAQKISQMGHWELDLTDNKLTWSDEIYRIFDIDPEKFGASYEAFLSAIHPEDRDMVNDAYSSSLETKEPYEVAHRLLLPDGSLKYVLEKCKTDYDDKGRPLRSIGTVQDVTVQREAEIKVEINYQIQRAISAILKLSLEKSPLEEILERALETILSLEYFDFEGRGCIYNVEGETEGLEIKINKGMDTDQLQSCSQVPLGTCLCGRAASSGELRFIENIAEHEGLLYDYKKPFALYLVPIKSKDRVLGLINIAVKAGHVSNSFEVEILMSIADALAGIIERHRAEQALKDAKLKADASSKAKTEFLANMSHEIRTPMTSIIGMSELLSTTTIDEEQKGYIESLQRAGDNLVVLINDILDLSKIEAGAIDFEKVDFNLSEEIEKIIEIFRISADKKGLKLESSIAPDLPDFFTGDPVRLRQIVVNLTGNSLKFTDKGKVSIEVKKDKGSLDGPYILHFIVSDTGIGITPDKLETIFEDFSQADSSTTRTHGGTGLGLAISKKLVEMMGGGICVESHEEKGSEFHFTLPLEAATKKDQKPVEDKAAPQDVGRPLNILLVEDSEDNRMLIEMFLKKTHHSLEMAENGKIGLDKFKAGKYDLVLMDMQMPVMDGYTSTAEIRKWELENSSKPVPVIAFTAHALKEEVKQCLDAGCTAHLAKPVKKDGLLKAIEEQAVHDGKSLKG